MSQFSPDNDTWASESFEVVAGAATTKRRLLALGAAGSAVLLTVGAWVVFTAGDEPLETLQPAAADPFLTPSPIPPAPPVSADVDPVAPTVNPAAGRDPFVPLVVPLASPAAATGDTTPYPSVTPYSSVTPTPNPTPTATPTPAPAGKKKSPPTNGPVL